jgi:iron(III) transport system ATP-binding protein
MAHLEIRALNKRFGNFIALDQIELSAEKGEFVVLLGPSGCGKTTLLRTLAGLECQDSGQIMHGGRDISLLPAAQRDYGIVFQSYALFPNLSIADNVAYGLNPRRHNRALVKQRVEEMLALVGLPGTQAKYPAQLSGGQQQRIALARALATSPDLLLLDEPLSALDAIERVRLRGEIRNLQKRLGVTAIMVTHDQEEALAMADRIVVMQQGRIQQTGSPRHIYCAPSNAFVADFIGRANVLWATVNPDGTADFGNLRLRPRHCPPTPLSQRFYVRPEDIRLCDTLENAPNAFYAQVLRGEFLGAHSLFSFAIDGAPEQILQAQFSTNYLNGRELHPGALVRLAISPEHLAPLPEVA